MNQENNNGRVEREFKITSLALRNSNTVFILTFAIVLFGIISFNNLPKELFPEVAFPTVMIQTVYPGNAPADIENLITRPLEKEIETVNGIKTMSSNSLQDISFITAEFSFDVDLDEAIKDKEVIIEPNFPSKGVRVAFILENGVPVEFLEFKQTEKN